VADLPPLPPLPPQSLPPLPPLPAGGNLPPGQCRCPFCQHVIDASSHNCPACGAPVDVRLAVSDSGWTELPAIRDMAKIQFGQSTCQIEGKYVPVADFNLAANDGVYFAHHLLLWKDDHAKISAMPIKRAITRFFAGMPLVMTQASGPGRIAFSKDRPGELLALPLEPRQAVDVREHIFMIATHSIAYDWLQTNVYFTTSKESMLTGETSKETETHYPIGKYMDRFTAGDSPGLLLLHGGGNIFVRTLAPGQTILIKPSALLYKEPNVRMNLHIEHPGGTWLTARRTRYLWLRLTGPGRVAVQSHYERMEDPGTNLSGYQPYTTVHNW